MRLTLNGRGVDLASPPAARLLDVLREECRLTGTKEGCGEGECGACTVLLAEGGGPRRAVYACLTLAAACEGAEVTTIEGIAPPGGALHPLQRAFAAHDAVQCGFCTPGQILAALALLEGDPAPTEEAIVRATSGNLCRCGTYPKIVRAVAAAADEMRGTA